MVCGIDLDLEGWPHDLVYDARVTLWVAPECDLADAVLLQQARFDQIYAGAEWPDGIIAVAAEHQRVVNARFCR